MTYIAVSWQGVHTMAWAAIGTTAAIALFAVLLRHQLQMGSDRGMKLLNCLECRDIVRLDFVERRCRCKRCGGRYVDQVTVEYSGPARIIGIRNRDYGQGIGTWWTIPKRSEHVRRVSR